jgi:hypothetical protein
MSMSAPSITMPEDDLRWNLPARGPVGMYCLIAAEAAIFTIFVVAYIFYIGKSVTGPQPRRCAPCSDLPDDLSAVEQSDDSLRREAAEEREECFLWPSGGF